MASRLPKASARKTAVRSPTKRMPSAPITRGSGLPLGVLDIAQNVGGRFGAHALQREQLLGGERIQIGHAVGQAAIHQLIHQRLAHAIDIHHAARGEMQNRLLEPRRAVDVDAAAGGLALFAHHRAAANRARFGHAERLAHGALRADPHHLGNHVAAALDDHLVADLQAQPLDLVFIVQRGAGHGHAADFSWGRGRPPA
jgi:hypothetical protein